MLGGMKFLSVDSLPVGLRSTISHRDLKAGEILFRRNDRALAIFGVVTGRLRLVRHMADGHTITIHVALPGDGLAEAALFSETYHCEAIADPPSRIVVLPKAPYLEALRADPELALSFAAVQARSIQSLRSRIELRNIRSARERALQYLMLSAVGGDSTVPIDRPLKEMASEIGLTHEAFYRALARLEDEGAIVRTKQAIRLRAL